MGLIGQEENGRYLAYHYDLRGSTVALTNEEGEVTDRFWYGPYGELVRHEGGSDTPFLYNGRDGVMTDPNGLYYLRARYYNPEIKRFVSRDVGEGDIWNGQSLNRFSYVSGNPVTAVDPSGQVTVGIGVSVSGGLGKGGTLQAMLVFDFEGNVGLAFTAGGGGYAGGSASAGVVFQATSARTIKELEGLGASAGVSFSLPLRFKPMAAAEYPAGLDPARQGPVYSGGELTFGASIGLLRGIDLPIEFTGYFTGTKVYSLKELFFRRPARDFK